MQAYDKCISSNMAEFVVVLAARDRNRTDAILVDINRFYAMT